MTDKSKEHQDQNIDMDDRVPLPLKGSEQHHDLKDKSKKKSKDKE